MADQIGYGDSGCGRCGEIAILEAEIDRLRATAEVFILISEQGEYEDFTRSVLGVFSSENAAREAIPVFQALAESQWQLYQEREKRRVEYLADHFMPDEVYPPGSPFPAGHIRYKEPQYREADAAIGPEVTLVSAGQDGYKYVVERFGLNAIEPHS